MKDAGEIVLLPPPPPLPPTAPHDVVCQLLKCDLDLPSHIAVISTSYIILNKSTRMVWFQYHPQTQTCLLNRRVQLACSVHSSDVWCNEDPAVDRCLHKDGAILRLMTHWQLVLFVQLGKKAELVANLCLTGIKNVILSLLSKRSCQQDSSN